MNATPRLGFGQLAGLHRICLRQVHSGKPRRPTTGFQGPEGHGEKLWVFSHRRTDQVIYSLKQQLDSHHSMKQLPFNGKKTKPAKLRKDYWAPFAVIQFPQGQGAAGRTVYQKLRELKHLHEVAWTDEFLYKREKEFSDDERKRAAEAAKAGREYRPLRNKKQRGIALNAQKLNSIADMAAVLGGAGPGNKVVTSTDGETGGRTLMDVTVKWANDQDRNYAEEWSSNVTHDLFEEPSYSADGTSTLVPAEAVEA